MKFLSKSEKIASKNCVFAARGLWTSIRSTLGGPEAPRGSFSDLQKRETSPNGVRQWVGEPPGRAISHRSNLLTFRRRTLDASTLGGSADLDTKLRPKRREEKRRDETRRDERRGEERIGEEENNKRRREEEDQRRR